MSIFRTATAALVVVTAFATATPAQANGVERRCAELSTLFRATAAEQAVYTRNCVKQERNKTGAKSATKNTQATRAPSRQARNTPATRTSSRQATKPTRVHQSRPRIVVDVPVPAYTHQVPRYWPGYANISNAGLQRAADLGSGNPLDPSNTYTIESIGTQYDAARGRSRFQHANYAPVTTEAARYAPTPVASRSYYDPSYVTTECLTSARRAGWNLNDPEYDGEGVKSFIRDNCQAGRVRVAKSKHYTSHARAAAPIYAAVTTATPRR